MVAIMASATCHLLQVWVRHISVSPGRGTVDCCSVLSLRFASIELDGNKFLMSQKPSFIFWKTSGLDDAWNERLSFFVVRDFCAYSIKISAIDLHILELNSA